MKNNTSIAKHLHNVTPYCYLSGNICVSCDDTSTIYINPINQINDPVTYESKNETGKIILFQSNIPHYTTVHKSEKERITIAFDIMLHKRNLKNLVKLI